MLKPTLIGSLLIAATLAAGCQRVVLVSFSDTSNSGLAVSKLSVEGKNPIKGTRILNSLSDTIGYFDVSMSRITIHTIVCVGGEEFADVTDDYPVADNAVLVTLNLADQHVGCPIPGSDAGAGGAEAAGGAGQGGAAGGETGGTTGSGGAGGMMTIGAGGNDASDAGADTAECGTDTHTTCNPPAPDGGTVVPPPATFSAACDSYCSAIQTNCTGANRAYDDMETCRRYCNDVAWAPGNGSQTDNSLGCRTYYATFAANALGPQLPMVCGAAGPSGGAFCGATCEDFCAALSALCPSTPHLDSCMTTCGSFQMGTLEPRCRFAYLQKTVFDSAYCDFANYGSCLSCAN